MLKDCKSFTCPGNLIKQSKTLCLEFGGIDSLHMTSLYDWSYSVNRIYLI